MIFITYLFNLTILIQTSKPYNKIICICTSAIWTVSVVLYINSMLVGTEY